MVFLSQLDFPCNESVAFFDKNDLSMFVGLDRLFRNSDIHSVAAYGNFGLEIYAGMKTAGCVIQNDARKSGSGFLQNMRADKQNFAANGRFVLLYIQD